MVKNLKIITLFILVFLTVGKVQAGKKYGLYIGINSYSGNPLKGCVNDAKKWRDFLKNEFGVDADNSDILLELQATRDNIISAIKKYQTKVSLGDVFVMTYSGHGTLVPDSVSEYKDETEKVEILPRYPLDYYDSAICPIDSSSTTSGKPWHNLILDDELYELFSDFTAKGAMVYFVSDSCHSGTLARGLNRNAVKFDKFKNNNALYRFIPVQTILNLSSLSDLKKNTNMRKAQKEETTNKLLLVLAGAKDNQYSLDVTFPEGRQGLFTAFFVEQYYKLKKSGATPTFESVMTKTRPLVEDFSLNISSESVKSPQIPQFDSRFFCGSLDIPLFSFPSCGNNMGGTIARKTLRIVAKVTDAKGVPISGCAFGVLKYGTDTSPQSIEMNNVILLGRTNNKGFYDSASATVEPGRYLVKVIRAGYKSFVQEVQVTESQDGVAFLSFKLVRQ